MDKCATFLHDVLTPLLCHMTVQSMAQRTLDKYFSAVNVVEEIANCDSQLQCCSGEGSDTNTSQIITSEVVVVTTDE